jgi:hypothetical protein
VLNLFIPGDWHEFQIAASQENLATLLAPRYKRLQFQLPHTSPRVWGRGVMVGLGEGAKRDAPLFNTTHTAAHEKIASMSFAEYQLRTLKARLSFSLGGFDKDVLERFYSLTPDQLTRLFNRNLTTTKMPHAPDRRRC